MDLGRAVISIDEVLLAETGSTEVFVTTASLVKMPTSLTLVAYVTDFSEPGNRVPKLHVMTPSEWEQGVLPKKNEKAGKQIDRTWDLTFEAKRDARWKGQQRDINAAIDRGVAHLRTLQKKNSAFEPHGKYKVGTTSLAKLCSDASTEPVRSPGGTAQVTRSVIRFCRIKPFSSARTSYPR